MARKKIAKKPKPAPARHKKASRPNLPERILDVAEELFGRVGYGGATTRAIASRARVNVGQLHYYFDSKRAIFEAVVARHGTEVTERRRQLLHEAQARGDFGEKALAPGLQEEATVVAVQSGLENDHVRNVGRYEFHAGPVSGFVDH